MLSSFVSKSQERKNDKPNVIIIMTDDQGFGDLGFYGNPHVITPTIDDLARESVRFDQFIVSPVCAPTRAALMTGRYPLRTGVRDTYRGGAIMSTHEITIAEILKNVGYRTGMVGKWHLGDNYPSRPQDQGFDFTVRHLSGGIGQPGDWPNTRKRDSSYLNPILWKNEKMFQSEGYCTDVFTDAAIDFIDQNKEAPFFLYLAYNAPHAPLQVPQKYYDKYKDIDPSSGFENDQRPFPQMNDKMKEQARKVYAMVLNIDDNLKRLFQNLENSGLKDNTLVIFLTDNGHQHDRYAAGMRGRKSYVYEGGVRVPSFWRLPSEFKGNRDIKIPAAHYDILPTLAELCNAQLPDDRKLDGQSLVPILTDKKHDLNNRSIVRSWVRGGPKKYENISIRKGDYKLVGNSEATDDITKFELFDLKHDYFEQNNIVNGAIEKAKGLKKEMDNWLDEMLNEPNFVNSHAAIIATEHESPTFLNLNDAIFNKDEILHQDIASWDIAVANKRLFDITIHLGRKIMGKTELKLQIGDMEIVQDYTTIPEGILKVDNVPLEKGEVKLTPFITGPKGGYIKPFYVQIAPKD